VEAHPGSRLSPDGLLAFPVPAGADPLIALEGLLGLLEDAGDPRETGL